MPCIFCAIRLSSVHLACESVICRLARNVFTRLHKFLKPQITRIRVKLIDATGIFRYDGTKNGGKSIWMHRILKEERKL